MPEKAKNKKKLATARFTAYYSSKNYTITNDTKALKFMFPAAKNDSAKKRQE